MSENEAVSLKEHAEKAEVEEQKVEAEGLEAEEAATEGDEAAEAEQEEADGSQDDEAARWKTHARRNERRAKRAERQLRELKVSSQARESVEREEPKASPGEPRPEDFDDREDYVVAKAEWKIEQRRSAERRKSEKDRAAEDARREWAGFQDACDNWDDRPDDFDEVTFENEGLVMSSLMLSAVMGADNSPQVAYYLGTHPDESERISKLSSVGQARAIGRIDARFDKPGASAEPPRRRTKAPPPIKPIQGSGDSVPDPSKMSPDEYRKHRGYDKLDRP